MEAGAVRSDRYELTTTHFVSNLMGSVHRVRVGCYNNKRLNTPHSNPYLLHRLSVDPWQHWLLIAAMVSDVRHLFPNLLKTPIRFLLRLAGRTPLTGARD